MKKWNLAAAFLGCALCAAVMVGAAYDSQPRDVEGAGSGTAESSAYEAEVESASDRVAESETAAEETATIAREQGPAQAQTHVQTEAKAASASGLEGEDSPKAEPAAQAVPQPQAKKTAQGSAAAPEKKVSAEVEAPAGTVADSMETDARQVAASSESTEEAAAKASTITINGVEIDYVDSFGTSSAPDSSAGLWMGSDSTTDGGMGYFIGHDYTEFGDVASLEHGSTVSVTDGNGDSCDYEVVDSFVVPRGSYWSDISDRVTGHGESIVMQTCVDDGYLIVVAE